MVLDGAFAETFAAKATAIRLKTRRCHPTRMCRKSFIGESMSTVWDGPPLYTIDQSEDNLKLSSHNFQSAFLFTVYATAVFLAVKA